MTLESLLRGFVRILISQNDGAADEKLIVAARKTASEMEQRGTPLVMLELWLRDPRNTDPATVCTELQRAIDAGLG